MHFDWGQLMSQAPSGTVIYVARWPLGHGSAPLAECNGNRGATLARPPLNSTAIPL